jgi:putative SOS response-associated peptidase YedK
MCGRFTQQRPTSELAEIFGAEDLVDAAGGRFNVAPTDEAAVVVQREDRRAVTAYRWGLVPFWAKDPKIGNKLFNARAETVATAPAFRDSFLKRRCLVPVDSFYEWRREAKGKRPFSIDRPDGRPLALAGLWSGWKDKETGEIRRTFTILTTGPNALMRTIHDRMPVVVPEEDWDRWLDPTADDPDELVALLVPAADGSLEAHPVSRLVNDARNDGPALVEPLGPPEGIDERSGTTLAPDERDGEGPGPDAGAATDPSLFGGPSAAEDAPRDGLRRKESPTGGQGLRRSRTGDQGNETGT